MSNAPKLCRHELPYENCIRCLRQDVERFRFTLQAIADGAGDKGWDMKARAKGALGITDVY